MNQNLPRYFKLKKIDGVAFAIICAGIILRLVYYLQNRCLFIDEANIARNLYERGFMGLIKPLSYEQYAPPLFLWIIKSFALTLGYGEMALRLYSLLCGIGALYLMYVLLSKYAGRAGIWYALFILAAGYIYVRYATEVKQYMSDVLIAISLILLALKYDILKSRTAYFFIFWCVAGSVSIWLSMPCVFILAGVGIYYISIVLQQKAYTRLLPIAGIGIVWLLQFYVYYSAILKPQIQSDYLQNYHKEFFLTAIPHSIADIKHNMHVLKEVVAAMGGDKIVAWVFNAVAIIIGIGSLLYRYSNKAILIVIPIAGLIAAAALHQYALTDRIILFIMPLLLVYAAVGVEQMIAIARPGMLQVAVVLIAAVSALSFNSFSLLYKRRDKEQMTSSLNFLKKEQVTGNHIYVHPLAGADYIYYTTIHPNRNSWFAQANGNILHWQMSYDSLARSFSDRSAIIYSWAEDTEIDSERTAISKHHAEVASHIAEGARVYIYAK